MCLMCLHFYATGRCCSLGPLTVQTLPPLAGPVSVFRVLARGTSLARLHQGPFRSSILSTDVLIRDARSRDRWERRAVPTEKRACPTKWEFLANNTKIFEPSSFPPIFLFLLSLFTCPRRGSRVHSPWAFRNYPENGHGWPFLETGPVLDMHRRTSTRQWWAIYLSLIAIVIFVIILYDDFI